MLNAVWASITAGVPLCPFVTETTLISRNETIMLTTATVAVR